MFLLGDGGVHSRFCFVVVAFVVVSGFGVVTVDICVGDIVVHCSVGAVCNVRAFVSGDHRQPCSGLTSPKPTSCC